MWWSTDRVSIRGYPVGVVGEPIAVDRVREAFDLLEQIWPGYLARSRRHVAGILVGPLVGASGRWYRRPRLVGLDEGFVSDPRFCIEQVASTVVHELTHARIDAAGIPWNDSNRIRIERVCTRRELAFARSLPPGEAGAYVIEQIEDHLERAEELWSDEASDGHARSDLKKMGVPARLVEAGMWLRARIRRRRRRTDAG